MAQRKQPAAPKAAGIDRTREITPAALRRQPGQRYERKYFADGSFADFDAVELILYVKTRNEELRQLHEAMEWGRDEVRAERAQQPREAAKKPRPKARKVDSDAIRREYDALRVGHDDKTARSKLLAKGKWDYQQIYRATKKPSQ